MLLYVYLFFGNLACKCEKVKGPSTVLCGDKLPLILIKAVQASDWDQSQWLCAHV